MAATGAVLRTPVYGQSQAPSAGRVRGANERVVVAVIGMGGRGNSHVNSFRAAKHVELGYVCDVDATRLAAAKKSVESKSGAVKTATDYRRVLEDKGVDAISIATPNFWHAIAAIHGCQAGKHVYVEKPGSHNAREAELLVAAATKHQRIVQMGNQRRSYANVREGIERLRAGAIGRVLQAKTWYYNARPTIGRGKTVPVPEHLNWELWQGPCPDRPYKDNLHPYNWHWLWHYGGGEMANNGIHAIDVARWGLGVTYPKQVSYVGGRYHFEDDQETPDTAMATFDFGHCGLTWEQSSCTQRKPENPPMVAFYGDKGSLVMSGRDEYTIYATDGAQVEAKAPGASGGGDLPHYQNFIDAIREGRPLNSPIAEGQVSTMLCHLANIAYRTGKALAVDRQTGRVQDADAMKLWGREYRRGWEPKV